MSIKERNGAILIITLWIITILTVLCVSVAHRSAIVLKLASYHADKIKAYLIAKAGIYSVLALKALEYEKGLSQTIDAASEPWANKPEIFKSHSFNGGLYTLSYSMPDEKNILYGLSDESSKININKAQPEILARLLILCGAEEPEAEEIAYCIVDWRDEDNNIGQDARSERMLGAEDEYYQGIEKPYKCKNSAFEIIEELLLVKGIDKNLFYGHKDDKGGVFYGLKDFVTVYTDGEVNINTAPQVVLSVLFGEVFDQLSEKIAAYRRGRDGILGTRDDRWFSTGPYIIERGKEGMVEVKNLSDGDWLGNIYGITTEEYNKIKELMQGQGVKITTASKVYRVLAEGEVRKVKSVIEAVYEFEQEKENPVIKFWYQE